MSSQILVHGYIEIPEGSERENVATIASLRASAGGPILDALCPPRPGWRCSMLAFATSLRRNTDADFDALRVVFEQILMQLTCRSAHLSIEDEETGPRHFVYAYGPLGGSEEHVWIRVPQTRTLGAEELVLESANGRTRGPLG
jgi:hypothetical protein